MPTTRDRIEEILRQHPDGLTAKEIAKLMDRCELDTSGILRKMSHKDRVTSVMVDDQIKWQAN